MLTYPEINPVLIKIGPLAIHWYGVMYLVGLVGGWLLLQRRLQRLNWSVDQLTDLIGYVAFGVIFGGRLGYVLFYDPLYFLQHPLRIFAMWDGGMSFHGGFLGVMVATWLYSRNHKQNFFDITDFLIPAVPVGLGAGRIGNFINGELWGKITNVPWAMKLPCNDPRFTSYCNGQVTGFSQPHHPSQLYEFFLEGVVLFIVLWWFSSKPEPRMAVTGLFALLYGIFRVLIELVRLPDAQLGYLALGWVTMGQILSIPLIIVGIVLLKMAYSTKQSPTPYR